MLVSLATRELVDGADSVSFMDVGEHQLKDLTGPQPLFQVVADGLETAFPPPRSLTGRPTNLPIQGTPLVGRERELAELAALMTRSRLVTLTGPGGIGKTRLAVRAAADSVDEFAGGTYFVPLDGVADPALVPAAVASTIGVRGEPGESLADALAEQLSERPVLLVLDNFEHLLQAAPELSRLLERCAPLRVVATSQVALRVAAEHEYPSARSETTTRSRSSANAHVPSGRTSSRRGRGCRTRDLCPRRWPPVGGRARSGTLKVLTGTRAGGEARSTIVGAHGGRP